MGITKLIKIGFKTIASTGAYTLVGMIASDVVKRKNVGPIKKACAFVGAYVIGMMVEDAVDKYVENRVDDVEKSITEFKNAINKMNENNSEEEENG